MIVLGLAQMCKKVCYFTIDVYDILTVRLRKNNMDIDTI